jgi:hypothetical protein
MIDPELEAIHKCTELLRDLDDEAKVRVLQYLVSRYKLSTSQRENFIPSSIGDRNLTQSAETPTTDNSNKQPEVSSHIPTHKEIAIKKYAKTEVDWVLIYCFYVSDNGKNEFTRENIVEEYHNSKRWSTNTSKSLTGNINAAIKKDWITPFNDTEFVMQEEGIKYVHEIFSGNSTSKSRGRSSTSKKTE